MSFYLHLMVYQSCCVFNLSYLTALNSMDNLIQRIDFMPNYTKDELLKLLIDRKEKIKTFIL